MNVLILVGHEFDFFVDPFCCLCLSYCLVFSPFTFVVNCWERAGILAVLYMHFVTLPFGILGQVWYLILSIPDLCLLHNLNNTRNEPYDSFA